MFLTQWIKMYDKTNKQKSAMCILRTFGEMFRKMCPKTMERSNLLLILYQSTACMDQHFFLFIITLIATAAWALKARMMSWDFIFHLWRECHFYRFLLLYCDIFRGSFWPSSSITVFPGSSKPSTFSATSHCFFFVFCFFFKKIKKIRLFLVQSLFTSILF